MMPADSGFLSLTKSLIRGRSLPRPVPRILIVDDEPGIRAFLVRSMSGVECEIVVAPDGGPVSYSTVPSPSPFSV